MAQREREGSAHLFEVVVERDVMVAMRDGVRLATDIYRPARGGTLASGRFPVIIERTPYDKGAPRFVMPARFFAEHGYVVLMQDVRGRGGSEGEWYAFAREAPDGYDTIEWANRGRPARSVQWEPRTWRRRRAPRPRSTRRIWPRCS
jgi:uncharacterized protein